jgi:ATP-dependent protease ClpP protease subunit
MKRMPGTVKMGSQPEAIKFRLTREALARYDASIRSAEKSSSEIEILGAIGEDIWSEQFTTAKMVKDQLKALGSKPVLVTINSPGGNAFEGIAMYNLLREHKATVTVNVIGIAASAASIIAMAGDTIKMGEATQMMIHSSHGIVIGNQEDMREFADLLDQMDKSVAVVYASRSGKTEDEVLEMMRAETWMTGKDAVAQGFADVMVPAEKKKAKAGQTTTISLKGKDFNAQAARELMAATGNRQFSVVRLSASPGDTGSKPPNRKGSDMKTIAEQIAALEAKRAASAARREEIQGKAIEEGRTKDEAEREEFTTLSGEIKSVDDELIDLRLMETQAVATAKPVRSTVERTDDVTRGAELRGAGPITVKSNLPKGIGFSRYVRAMINGQGNPQLALLYAKSQRDWQTQSPEVAEYIKMTAVEGGDTTTSGWASEWVYNQNLVSEFIELLRPMTVIGKLTGLRRVPFNIRVSGQDSGSTAYWSGQGKAIPVSKLNAIEVTLGIAKATGLVVLTQELVRSSEPSAEMKVRDDLLGSISEFTDRQFLDPTVAAVSNVSPASITNGVTDLTPTGTTLATLRADIQTLFRNFINVNDDPTSATWILDTSQALAISMMQNALGQNEFPTLTMQGGTWFGLPAVVSNAANVAGSPDSGRMIILAKTSDIMFADDGGVQIDASREASIEMTDAPTGDAAAGTAGTTSLVSMYQSNSVAVRAVRFVNWKKKRSTAVAYIGHAAYVA